MKYLMSLVEVKMDSAQQEIKYKFGDEVVMKDPNRHRLPGVLIVHSVSPCSRLIVVQYNSEDHLRSGLYEILASQVTKKMREELL